MSLLGLDLVHQGKVRDVYAVGDDKLLMVASDRLSAFDVVMAEPVPNKGRVLTAMTAFFTEEVADVAPSATIAFDPAGIEAVVPGFGSHPELFGRTMLVWKAEMLPLECIVRGRLAGQAAQEYLAHGTIHGEAFPPGLELAAAFDEPVFTPSTKAAVGDKDENISFDQAVGIVGEALAEEARALSLEVFRRAEARAAKSGLILADTKFELGLLDGALVLCDEVCTPDSSRLWPTDAVVLGQTPPAFDKQPFRDWLEALGWDKQPPPPPVPPEIIEVTAERYVAAYEKVTGRSLEDWYGQAP